MCNNPFSAIRYIVAYAMVWSLLGTKRVKIQKKFVVFKMQVTKVYSYVPNFIYCFDVLESPIYEYFKFNIRY